MFSLKIKRVLFLILFPWLLMAGEKPSFIIEENSILDEFRAQYRSKLTELSQNYIVNQTTRAITWRSHEGMKCENQWFSGKTILSSISMSQSGQFYLFELRGCGAKLLFVEIFEVQDGVHLSLAEYLKGEINIDQIRSYELRDSLKNRLFQMIKTNIVTSFSFLNNKFLEIYKQDKQWQYKALGYQASYNNNGFGFNVTMLFPDQRLSVNWEEDDVRLFDQDFNRIPVNSFLTSYSHAIQNSTLSFMATMIRNFMKSLPNTEFVSSGGQNSRFLDDMRLAYTRLLNNLELNLVKQLIQDIIKYLEDGVLKVTDNRPETK
tara:strand:+ start:29109 stop:30065 length:957 start_codon:yes stop_codon:yes gene_type:complete